MKKCLHCGKDFEPKKPKAIFCSDKCRTYAFRKSKSSKNNLIPIILPGPLIVPVVPKKEQIDPPKQNKISVNIRPENWGSMSRQEQYKWLKNNS